MEDQPCVSAEADRAPSGARCPAAARLGLASTCIVALGLVGVSLSRPPAARTADMETVSLEAAATRKGLIQWTAHPSMCADIPHGSAHKGNHLQLWRCSAGNPNMQFEVPEGGTGPIRFATHPHTCLDVLAGSIMNGSPVGLWHCGENDYHDNQLFVFPSGSSGSIRWKSHPHKCLDVSGGSAHNGNSIRLWDCLHDGRHTNQQFTLPAASSSRSTTPAPTPRPRPTARPAPGRPFCGVSSNVWDTKEHGDCSANMAYLRSLDHQAASAIACKEYGGRNDPCSIDINNDKNYGLGKSPAECSKSAAPRVLFLWDEPTTHRHRPTHHCSLHGTGGLPLCSVWAAATWKQYADRWSAELSRARRQGMRVASPRFHGGNMMKSFAEFFAACPECSDKDSRYYIDVLAFNAWVWNHARDNAEMAGNAHWIRGQAAALRGKYAGRPVYLADFASLGAAGAALQAEVLAGSGLVGERGSGLDAVYYFAAQDFGGGTKHNGLKEVVASGPFAGKTLGQVLLQQCRR